MVSRCGFILHLLLMIKAGHFFVYLKVVYVSLPGIVLLLVCFKKASLFPRTSSPNGERRRSFSGNQNSVGGKEATIISSYLDIPFTPKRKTV